MAERYCKACNGWHDLDRPWPAACYPKLEVARSGLPIPFVVSDIMEPVQHPCTGEYLTLSFFEHRNPSAMASPA